MHSIVGQASISCSNTEGGGGGEIMVDKYVFNVN